MVIVDVKMVSGFIPVKPSVKEVNPKSLTDSRKQSHDKCCYLCLSIFSEGIRLYRFSSQHCFLVCYKFGCIVFSFYSVQYLKNLLEPSSSLSYGSFSIQLFGDFPVVFPLVTSSLILLQSENILCMIAALLNCLRFVFCGPGHGPP